MLMCAGPIQQDEIRTKFIHDKYLEMAYTRPEKRDEILVESKTFLLYM